MMTLYDEIEFVNNGFNSVSKYLEKKSNLKKNKALKFLKKILLIIEVKNYSINYLKNLI